MVFFITSGPVMGCTRSDWGVNLTTHLSQDLYVVARGTLFFLLPSLLFCPEKITCRRYASAAWGPCDPVCLNNSHLLTDSPPAVLQVWWICAMQNRFMQKSQSCEHLRIVRMVKELRSCAQASPMLFCETCSCRGPRIQNGGSVRAYI